MTEMAILNWALRYKGLGHVSGKLVSVSENCWGRKTRQDRRGRKVSVCTCAQKVK